MVAYNNTHLFSHGSGGQKSAIELWAGLVPSGRPRGESVPCLSHLLEAACIPWLVAPSCIFRVHHPSLFPSSHLILWP